MLSKGTKGYDKTRSCSQQMAQTALALSLLVSYAVSQEFTKVEAAVIVSDGGISGGVSWADYDNDGDLDLFVTNAQDTENFLYQNQGSGEFIKITSGPVATDINRSAGNSWGDYDNDGDLDLFVSNQEQNDRLYRNDGNGEFTPIVDGAIVNNPGDSHHCSWGDFNNDGNIDLFVANGGFNGAEPNFLYVSNGDGTFSHVDSGPVVEDNHDTFGGNWGDYDNDGDLDLFVAHFNNGANLLYRNEGDGSFVRIEDGEIVTDRASSIGSSWADYDNDGDLDLFVANWDNQDNHLYENLGNGSFAGVIGGDIVEDGGVSWVGMWGDYDNDGDLDLFVSNYNQDNFLYSNNGEGSFTKVAAGIVVNDGGLSSGTSWGDYDGDGDLDLFVANWQNQDNYFYINNGNDNRWITITCIGTQSNAAGLGAKVRVKATINGEDVWQMREISANTGLRSQNGLNAEFGLGNAEVVDSIKVEWPSSVVDILTDIEPNQFILIKENIGLNSTRPKEFPATASITLWADSRNPFTQTATVCFTADKRRPVRVAIYDAAGRCIQSLYEGVADDGLHQLTWDPKDEPSGVYYCTLEAGKIMYTTRLLRMK